MAIKVWVLSDHDGFGTALRMQLAAAGMDARLIEHIDEWQRVIEGPGDIVVCDADLQGESGYAIAARLRMATSAGVILLGSSDRQEDRLLGLSMGVDHYLVKPAQPRELDLLIRNLHRRLMRPETRLAEPPSRPSHAPVHGGSEPGWCYDTSAWRLVTPDGVEVTLSLAEYLLLGRLIEVSGEVVSRDDLIETLTRRKARIYSRNLDMVVSRLRRKVESLSAHKLPVQAARGIGYVFTGRCEIGGCVRRLQRSA